MAFVIVANLDDLEVGDTMLVDELREPVCLIRLDDDDVRAIHNTCTHQQQPLHEGTVQDDDTLVCAAHASRYNLTTGEAVGVFACGPIPVYACKIEDDAILVDIDQQLNDAPISHPPHHQARSWPSSADPRPGCGAGRGRCDLCDAVRGRGRSGGQRPTSVSQRRPRRQCRDSPAGP